MKFATKFTPPEVITTDETGETCTDISQREDTDIYALINKYGINSLIDKGRPENELFIDTTIIPRNMTLAEANKLKSDFNEYFAKAPAKFRKLFKDNPDEFYNAYRQGEYDKLLSSGALTEEQIKLQKNAIKAERKNIYYELDKEINADAEQRNISNSNTIENKTSNKGD